MVYSEYINSEAWRALRLDALIRDQFKCVFCEKDAQHVHHTKYPPRGSWHLDSVENLQSVCADCHSKLHADKRMKLAVTLQQITTSSAPIQTDPTNGFKYAIYNGLVWTTVQNAVALFSSFSADDFDQAHYSHVLEVESEKHSDYKLKTTGTCEWAATYKEANGTEHRIFTVGGLLTCTASRRERIKIKAEAGAISAGDKKTLVLLDRIEDAARKMIDRYVSELIIKSIPSSKEPIDQFGIVTSNDKEAFYKAMTLLANTVSVQSTQISSAHNRLGVLEVKVSSLISASGLRLPPPANENALMSCADYLVSNGINPLTASRKYKQNLASRLGLVAGKRYGSAPHKELQVLESGLTVDASKRPLWQWDEAWKSVRSEEES